MKRFVQTMALNICVAGIILTGLSGPAFSQVCSSGTSEPPFLSYGVKSNLLILLDNSGSMLDMAYQDEQTYTTAAGNTYQNTCFDEGYTKEIDGSIDPDKVYVGYFEADTWYQWVEPIGWQTGTIYATDKIVSSNGKLYKATCTAAPCTSTGTNLQSDTGLIWNELGPDTVNEWANTQNYPAGSIVIYDSMLYRANAAANSLTNGSTTLFDDRDGGDNLLWDRLDEGYFQQTAPEPCATPSFSYVASNGRNDLQIKFDNAAAPTAVTCFAARGRFLNWASASKFDIQKGILTGGKFYAGYEARDGLGDIDNSITTDTGDDRIISESRGCSGKGFAKQITLNRNAAGGVVSQKLVFRISGAIEGIDKRDASDFTTRIEIVGINASGVDMERCADYIALIEADAVHSALRDPLADCMYGTKDIQPAFNIYHSALHDCWKISKGDDPPHAGNLKSHCEAVYQGKASFGNTYPQEDPWLIVPWDPHYLCYGGPWNPADPPTAANDWAGTGFIGRCWEDWPTGAGGVTCQQKTCNTGDGTWTEKGNKTKSYFKNQGGVGQQCTGGLQYKCEAGGSVNLAANNPSCSNPGEKFTPNMVLPDNAPCVPAAGTRTANQCYDSGIHNQGCWGSVAAGWGPQDAKDCIEQAERDYCSGLSVPEVIDPSDLVSPTGEVWGIGAALIDAGIYGQLGVEKPLIIMKGYVKYELPPNQLNDDLGRPDGPRGILFDNADDLRIGVMAFKENGSKTECDIFKATCTRNADDKFDVCTPKANINTPECKYCTARQSIEKFCPDTNYDGAEVLAPIGLGWMTTPTGEDWSHYIDIIAKTNEIRATTWTPLAEAMYTAIGYYGQKSDRCLTTDSSGNCLDFTVNPDPVQYWCQENHILIITEGASTADINQKVADFTITNNDGDPEIGFCSTGLEGSTYLDDLTWFAHKAAASDLYKDPQLPMPLDENSSNKKNITTHIVTTGSLETGADECSPEAIMTAAAANGGSPTGLLRGENPQALEDSLEALFAELRNRASAGSAASVISSARGGEGAIYQAIFWPELVRQNASNVDSTVAWAGDVHGLFLDSRGFMYEDSNNDRILKPLETTTPAGETADKDKRVIIFFNGTISQVCRGTTSIGTVIDDSSTCSPGQSALAMEDDEEGNRQYICCDEPAVNMEDVEYLWSANDWLSQISPLDNNGDQINDDILSNRDPFLSHELKRYIFTWNDLDNDGMVSDNEILDFATAPDPNDLSITWDTLPVSNRGPAPRDFDLLDHASVSGLVNWIRGKDDPALRSRQIPDANGSNNMITWRLGDIIHSTPMTVAAPAEGYHLIYNDYSYAQFLRRHKERRHVVYFGANDGMLHAVNAGFYSEAEKRFCLYPLASNGSCSESCPAPPDINGNCPVPWPESYADAPALGAELWAYVPYNLLPHLNCLTDPEYVHKYFVDQRPRIFDVQIFAEEPQCRDLLLGTTTFNDPDCIHPNGWGTILVGGMRFGGAPIEATDLNGVADDRKFTSSWFIMDITDPEKKPKLLGELSFKNDNSTVNLGYTTGMPTMAIMKGGPDITDTKWYLVFGSGPVDGDGAGDTDAIKGISDSNAKVSVLPLDWLITGGQQPLRISPDEPSVTGTHSGTFTLPSPNGFVSDMITVDYDINPSYKEYKSDVIYFGTVEGNFATYGDDKSYWNGGGKMYRLVTKEMNPDPLGNGEFWSTYGRFTTENMTTPADWQIRPLIDLTYSPPVVAHNYSPPNSTSTRYPQPITAAASVGTDGHNFWVYFGTGRFLDPDDKTDRQQQTYYGIKEPALIIQDSVTNKQTRYFKWYETAVNPDLSSPEFTTGDLGLTRVDDIMVGEHARIKEAPLTCKSTGGYDCLPSQIADAGHAFLYNLDLYISGLGSTSGGVQRRNEFGTILNNGGAAECWKHNGCTDGWYKDFFTTNPYQYQDRKKNTGQATLLGGLVTFSTYQPYSDICRAEGTSSLYGVYYRTGTPWHKNIFGTDGLNGDKVADNVSLGTGLAPTPNLHVGGGEEGNVRAMVQTSTGAIREIIQDNLPVDNYKTGRSKFRQCN